MAWAASILEKLCVFQSQGLYCDINLESHDGHCIPVHACVLGACSPEIHHELTSEGPFTTGTIIQMPLSLADLQDFVCYIYSSDFKVVDASPEFMSILSTLSIKVPRNTAEPNPDTDVQAISGVPPLPEGVSVATQTDVPLEKVEDSAEVGDSPPPADACVATETSPRLSEQKSVVGGTPKAGSIPSGTDGMPLVSVVADTGVSETAHSSATDSSTASTPQRRSQRKRTQTPKARSVKEAMRETHKTAASAVIDIAVKLEKEYHPVAAEDIVKAGVYPAQAMEPSDKSCDVDLDDSVDVTDSVSDDDSEHAGNERKPSKTKKQPPSKGGTKQDSVSKVCTICGRKFAKAWHRIRHELVHTGAKPFQCRHCEKSFTREISRKIHENIHTHEEVFQCRFCGDTFHDARKLQYHETVHTSSEKFQCKLCNKAFPFKASLNSHLRSHAGTKPFQCTLCGRSFSTKSVLTDHERSHRGEKNYNCSYCSKSFVRHSEQVVHERVHTGERPFKCRLCEKTFRSQSGRIEHERTHPEFTQPDEQHSAKSKAGFQLLAKKPKVEKPRIYPCSVCGKKWVKNCHRLRHEKTHLGLKPFKCEVAACGKAFGTVVHLQRHEKLVHNKGEKKERKRKLNLKPSKSISTREEAEAFITCIKQEPESGEQYFHLEEVSDQEQVQLVQGAELLNSVNNLK